MWIYLTPLNWTLKKWLRWWSYYFMFSSHTCTHTHTHTHPKGPKILFGNKISDSECFRTRTSLPVQWLELHASRAEGQGLTPGPRTKISNATWCSQKIRTKNTHQERKTRAVAGTHVRHKGPLGRFLCVAGGFLCSWGDCLWTTQARRRSLWMCPRPRGATANQDTRAREGNTKDTHKWLRAPGSQLTNQPKATLDRFMDWMLTWPKVWKLKIETNPVLCTSQLLRDLKHSNQGGKKVPVWGDGCVN